jgi:hypothetical protein
MARAISLLLSSGYSTMRLKELLLWFVVFWRGRDERIGSTPPNLRSQWGGPGGQSAESFRTASARFGLVRFDRSVPLSYHVLSPSVLRHSVHSLGTTRPVLRKAAEGVVYRQSRSQRARLPNTNHLASLWLTLVSLSSRKGYLLNLMLVRSLYAVFAARMPPFAISSISVNVLALISPGNT